MFKKILTASMIGVIALMSGCATLGGGQTNPILSKFVPNTLQDNPVILAGNATNSCNAAAAQEYNLNMVICLDPIKFAAGLPGNPFVTQEQIGQAIGVVCATNGYNSALPAQVQPDNCIFPAPSASARKRQMAWSHK